MHDAQHISQQQQPPLEELPLEQLATAASEL